MQLAPHRIDHKLRVTGTYALNCLSSVSLALRRCNVEAPVTAGQGCKKSLILSHPNLRNTDRTPINLYKPQNTRGFTRRTARSFVRSRL
jgi:hypothetical protein